MVYDESGTNILLVNSTRHGSDRMTHTIPSGKVESFDQDLETAAVRETIEEAGVECSVIWDLGWFISSTKTGQPTVTRLFLAQCTNILSTWREVIIINNVLIIIMFGSRNSVRGCGVVYQEHYPY